MKIRINAEVGKFILAVCSEAIERWENGQSKLPEKMIYDISRLRVQIGNKLLKNKKIKKQFEKQEANKNKRS